MCPRTMTLVARITFFFSREVPRRLAWKYRIKRFSPENIIRYIDEVKAARDHRDGRIRRSIADGEPIYDLLQMAVRDFQADEIRLMNKIIPADIDLTQRLAELRSRLNKLKAGIEDNSEPPYTVTRDVTLLRNETVLVSGIEWLLAEAHKRDPSLSLPEIESAIRQYPSAALSYIGCDPVLEHWTLIAYSGYCWSPDTVSIKIGPHPKQWRKAKKVTLAKAKELNKIMSH